MAYLNGFRDPAHDTGALESETISRTEYRVLFELVVCYDPTYREAGKNWAGERQAKYFRPCGGGWPNIPQKGVE